jgi:hypothetical protein
MLETAMKKHEFEQGEDICIHCHGTSSTPSECVERPPTQGDIADFCRRIPTIENNEPVFRALDVIPDRRGRDNGHQPHCGCEVCRMPKS